MSTLEHLNELGLSIDSEIGFFYLNYGSFSVRGWYELDEVGSISESTEYAHSELGVPEHFIALSGIEGEGIILYDRSNGSVFDVEFGQFENLTSGALAPVAHTFTGYLQWCKAKHDKARR